MTTAATAIRLPRPHSDGQMALLDCRYFDVVFAGRRWGKTQVGVYRILRAATAKVGLYWWVGLSWRSASMKRAWRLLKFYARKIWRALDQEPGNHIKEPVKEIDLPNGSSIWLRSAEKEDSLAGEAIRGAVVDEFSLMNEIVWTEYLEATLLDYEDSWALFIGVPKGRNWAANLWTKAAGRTGWRQHHFTTYDNPKMPRDRIEDIKLNNSERIFQQEYMAEILDDGGAVFRNIKPCFQKAEPTGGRYAMGVDWGKDNDYTALVVIDMPSRRVVDIDRFNQIGWHFQRGRLKLMAEKWNVFVILAEENSIGSPNIEELQREGLPVEPFYMSSSTKGDLIEGLALAFERVNIIIHEELPFSDLMQGELMSYTLERLPGGSYRYSAPDGSHDDTVIALALAYAASLREGGMRRVKLAQRRAH